MDPQSLYDSFRRAVTQARLDAGLTQQMVATRLGKPQSFVSKYESGERRLDVVEFILVCGAIDVQPNSIINLLGACNATK